MTGKKLLLLIVLPLTVALIFVLYPVWKSDPGGKRYFYSSLRSVKKAMKDTALPASSGNPGLPDIAVIVIDTVRFDSIFDPNTMDSTLPELKELLSRARIYENAYSTSCWTVPAHASMFTGYYPNVHKSDQENWYFGDKYQYLPEIMQNAGYFTAGFTENPNLASSTGFARGFSFYDDTYRRLFYDEWKTFRSTPKIKYTLTNSLADTVISHKKIQDRPLFLFVNFIDPHWPFIPLEDKYDPTGRRPYRKAIALQNKYTLVTWYLRLVSRAREDLNLVKYLYDLETRELAAKLLALIDLFENRPGGPKMIFVVSDHGENFGEGGHFFHMFNLRQILVKVPMFVVGTNIEPGRVSEPVSLVDLFPTILNQAKANAHSSEGVDLFGELDPDRPLFMSTSYPLHALKFFQPGDRKSKLLSRHLTGQQAVIKNGWKLITKDKGHPELYDLANDPAEAQNLVSTFTEKADELSIFLKKYKKNETDKYRAGKPGGVDQETMDSLRALGYVK